MTLFSQIFLNLISKIFWHFVYTNLSVPPYFGVSILVITNSGGTRPWEVVEEVEKNRHVLKYFKEHFARSVESAVTTVSNNVMSRCLPLLTFQNRCNFIPKFLKPDQYLQQNF